jgi:hypothetical protein
MALKQHATIAIESDNRALKSRSESDFVYQLTQSVRFIKKSQNKQYYVRIENVRIPVSFYNINSNNNVLTFLDAASSESATITPGNYTIDELLTELQVQMNLQVSGSPYTITYDDITQKVNIANSSANILTIQDTTALNSVIGFDNGQTIGGSSNDDGNNIGYTNTMRHLKLQIPNIVSNNLYSNDENLVTQIQPISVIIPITEIRNEFQFYSNHQGPLIKLANMMSLNEINVRLLDPTNNVVLLNGVPWGFEIVFYEYNK